MIHFMKYFALAFAFLSAFAAAQSPAIPVGTEPYSIAGEGKPVIVLNSGFGDDRLTWASVFPAISSVATVFAYDRPGFQASPEVFNPNNLADDGLTTLSEQATHLHGLLARAELAPPYILVAHSLGAPMMLAFARQYPDEVAGIVSVDGRTPGYTTACEAAGITTCRPTRESMSGRPQHWLAELEGSFSTENTETATAAELGDIPVTLIVALESIDANDASRQRAQEAWRADQRRFAAELSDARHLEVTSDHYIHIDHPEVVIAEVERMVSRVRTGTWPSP